MKTDEDVTADTPMSWRPWAIMMAGFLIPMLGLSAYAWRALPEGAQMATHWNIHGVADGFAPKSVGLLLLPGMLAVLVPFIVVLVRLDPRRAHVAQSQKFLLATMGAMMVTFAGIHLAMILIALGYRVSMDLVVLTLIGGLFAVIGNYMGKVRSNFFMGVRTPWTLSSELSWNKTHRLMGRAFLATGVLTVVTVWTLGGVVGTVVLLVGSMVSSFAAIGYSYVVWKGDRTRK